MAQVMAIGDDLPGGDARRAGCGVAVGDAAPAIKRAAHRVCLRWWWRRCQGDRMVLRSRGWVPDDRPSRQCGRVSEICVVDTGQTWLVSDLVPALLSASAWLVSQASPGIAAWCIGVMQAHPQRGPPSTISATRIEQTAAGLREGSSRCPPVPLEDGAVHLALRAPPIRHGRLTAACLRPVVIHAMIGERPAVERLTLQRSWWW